ncbi:farnesyl pyrophosphate synthase isoform X1 [Podarcis raffonei]|uniref:farnesyl pyrophosphate synthase isoform X1 n=1 Tax=Podarcis raffonei TaxID=65483 RepID=UPI002329580D|nr:farnesyl pyrophosphate synthase isoform X1 [Podarcis raffonei]
MSQNGVEAAAAATDMDQFVGFFPQVVKDLTEDDLHNAEVSDVVARLKQVVEYNAVGGKYNRGLTVVAAFRELAAPEQQDPKSFQRALAVGWCIELLQAFLLVADDIMDYSETRRGHPCWYKKEEIGLDAVNDAFLLESLIYRLLKRYCRGQPYYLNLLELFLQTSYQTELGQALDLITAPPSKVDLNRFTEQSVLHIYDSKLETFQVMTGSNLELRMPFSGRYKTIVKYKTAFYSFYLPVAAAMYMAGIDSEEEHAHARTILLQMGEFFQIQDDFLDCFGDPEMTGKIGTDIQDNKCSWLVVQCLKRASAEQRQLLEENYGQKDLDKVAHVKQLYEELGLKKIYQDYEESSYQCLSGLISQHAVRLPSQIFLGLAQKIYKRQK